MDNAPKQIRGLEQQFGIKLKRVEYNEISYINNRNSFTLDKQQHIIGLNLSENDISDISSLKGLTHLQGLYLDENRITSISSLRGLTHLQDLYLGENDIIDISSLKDLTHLQDLFLGENQITDISSLKGLTNLKTLSLRENQISDISSLKGLTHLQDLYLTNNQITDISSLKGLTHLQVLYLNNNDISDLKQLQYIKEIKSLKNLRFNNNPILETLNLKLEYHSNHLDTVLSKLKEQEEVKANITLPVKLMFLGNHAAGKSTFLEYLQTAKVKNRGTSTHILHIEEYPQKNTKGELPKAIIYDFGGQDYYHGLYQAFFSLDSINLLFWNKETDKNQMRLDSNQRTTRDFKRGYWLAQLKQAFQNERRYYKNVTTEPTFLIQTHADKENNEKQTWENKQETQKVSNEFYVSLHEDKYKTEVNEASLAYLKATILNGIELKQKPEEKPHWYQPFLNYILERNTTRSTNLSTIIKYYNRENLSPDEKQRFLKADLEQLALKGMVMYYKNDNSLNDVAWLNPSATVKDIHEEILSDDIIEENKGKLSAKDWKTICKDEKLERLLLLEKVVFYDEANKRYIIPNYLPLAEDDEYYNLLAFGFIKPNFILKFKYFIPFGIINQLICRFGNNPEYKAFWRDQLIFTYKNAKVFIKLDFEHLTINVYIQSEAVNDLEKEVFDIILRLYNNEDYEPWLQAESGLLEDSMNETLSADFKPTDSGLLDQISSIIESPKRLKDIKTLDVERFKFLNNKLKSPEDMYVSVDGKWFVKHIILEDEEKTQTRITAYQLKDNQINAHETKEQSSMVYANFTTNEKIKSMKKIFISYSRKDVDYKNALKNHLLPLATFDIADAWSCEDITIGKWDAQIQKELEESDLIIYMLSANFFSSRYILEKEVANVMKSIEEDKDKAILCVVVSDFVGVDVLKRAIGDRPKTQVQDGILKLGEHQYLPYDTVVDKATNNNHEKIVPLKIHTNNNTIETALTQIVNKVVEKLA